MARKLDSGRATSGRSTTLAEDEDEVAPDSGGLLGRREYVKLSLAAVAATAGVVTTTGGVVASAERDGITFERTLDAVDDLGMDPTGTESIVAQAQKIPADTLVQFPDGTYLIDERITFDHCGNLGFEATGDATFTVPAGFEDHAFDVCDSTTVYYSGFTHEESVSHHWETAERLSVEDVSVPDTRTSGTTLQSGSAGSGGANVSYEEIVLDPGEQRTYELSDGEVFEHVLIDQTANGAMFTITTADGANDWVLRNVGWKGLAPTGSNNRNHTFLINVRGDGLIENIFVDQRDHSGSGPGSDVGGIWTYSDHHHGHIECRHNFIAGFGNNGCYDSGDGWEHTAATGTVSHEYSYHRDNTPSNFRPGRPGSYIRNCVSIANDPDGKRGGYPATGSQLTRACWAWHNRDIVMENCAIWWDPDDVSPSNPFWATIRDGSEDSNCVLDVIDCDINDSWTADLATSGGDVVFDNLGNNPTVEVLGEGVPLSPEMAARGERALPPEVGTAPGAGHGESSGSEPTNPPEEEDSTEDELPDEDEENPEDDDELPEDEEEDESPADDSDEQIDDPDDTEAFDHEFRYENASGVHTGLPRELVIEQIEPGARVAYEVEVDGELEAGEFEFPATVDGSTATGQMGPERGLDNLYFDGDITHFDGEHLDHTRVLVADAETRTVLDEYDATTFPDDVDPFSYAMAQGVHTDLPLELVIDHVEPGERVEYELEVDGALEPGEFDYPPQVDGTTATGGLGADRGLDNLYFDGAITRFEGEHLDHIRLFLADAQTRTIIDELDPHALPDVEERAKTIRIVGQGTTANYDITVSGDLCDDPDVEFDSSGNISGGNAEGSVSDSEHGYRFTGDLVDLQVDGHAELFVDGRQLDADNGELDGIVRIDGSVGDGVTRYRFSVTGSVEYSETESSGEPETWDKLEDHVTDDSVTGIVHNRIDAYRYSGDIVSLNVTGSADIEFE